MVKCKKLALKAIAASLILMYPMEPMRYIPNIHIFVRVIGERLTSSSYPSQELEIGSQWFVCLQYIFFESTLNRKGWLNYSWLV